MTDFLLEWSCKSRLIVMHFGLIGSLNNYWSNKISLCTTWNFGCWNCLRSWELFPNFLWTCLYQELHLLSDGGWRKKPSVLQKKEVVPPSRTWLEGLLAHCVTFPRKTWTNICPLLTGWWGPSTASSPPWCSFVNECSLGLVMEQGDLKGSCITEKQNASSRKLHPWSPVHFLGISPANLLAPPEQLFEVFHNFGEGSCDSCSFRRLVSFLSPGSLLPQSRTECFS